jgi:hypothetical protein
MTGKHDRYGFEKTGDALFEAILHLFGDLGKGEYRVVAVKGNAPLTIVLFPVSAIALNNALAEE